MLFIFGYPRLDGEFEEDFMIPTFILNLYYIHSDTGGRIPASGLTDFIDNN